MTDVETIKAKRPEVEIHVYPGAQHGFHCDERASYDKASADIAWPRSLDVLRKAFEEVDWPTVPTVGQNQRSPTSTVSPG